MTKDIIDLELDDIVKETCGIFKDHNDGDISDDSVSRLMMLGFRYVSLMERKMEEDENGEIATFAKFQE